VQALLTENRQGGSRTAGSSEPCLLSGFLFDDRGNAMSPSHACKANGRRYRYYVSQAVLQGRREGAGSIRRVSAEAIDSLIERALCKSWPKAKQTEWALLSIEQKRERIKRLIERITIRAENVEIGLTEPGRDLSVDTAPSGSIHIATVMRACGFRRSRPSIPNDVGHLIPIEAGRGFRLMSAGVAGAPLVCCRLASHRLHGQAAECWEASFLRNESPLSLIR
jgi:hypothetical protein